MERENEIGKKIDYERLKKLIGKDKDDSTSKKKDTKKAPAAKTQRGGKNKKSAVKSDSEQSDVDDFEKKSSENEMDLVAEDGEVVESDSEDDLFNSDEEEEITRRTQAENKNVVDAGDDEEDDSDAAPNGNSKSKVLGKKRKSSGSSKRNRAKRSKRGKRYDSDSDDEDDEDDEEEEEEGNLEEEEEEEGSGREDEYDREDSNLQDIKNSFKRRNEDGNRPGGRAAAIKAPTYHSLSELKQHYEKQLQKDLPIKPDDKDPADHMDIKKLFKRRDEVIRLLNEPFFEELIVGCFVRYLIGIVDNLQVYRMCEVIAVDRTKRSYKVPPLANGEVVETTVRLTLSNAGEIKSNQKLDKLSNHTISEKEIDFHLEGMRSRKKAEYTKRQLRLTRNHHKQYADHVYNHSEISGMIAKKELNRLLTTEYTAAMESLKKDLEKAKAAEDPNNEQIEFISKEIRKLEKIDEKQKEIFERNLKRQTEINHRMRESNVKRDMEAGMKKRTEEQAAIAKGILPNAISDPFIR
jgi:RNA polymerase-associated protein RTF1